MLHHSSLSHALSRRGKVVNAITIDVEDWFHVSRFSSIIDKSHWPYMESRVVGNIHRILRLLRNYNVKATFFILAWIAEHHPEIVWDIKKGGHEIGTHGYSHSLIYEQSREEFSYDLIKSLNVLKIILGNSVISYRAPSFSINPQTLWAFEVLKENGIEIDSSLFPIHHDLYGEFISPTIFFKIPVHNNGYIIECPVATVPIANRNFPIAGGGYLRMFPIWIIERGIRSLNKKGISAVVYFHPWEMDTGLPRIAAGWKDRLLHYNNIDSTEKKLVRLLSKFTFSTLKDVVSSNEIIEIWPRW
jgi:polysaccharide deacetylase family protein (PEP-CTERM system associated)